MRLRGRVVLRTCKGVLMYQRGLLQALLLCSSRAMLWHLVLLVRAVVC